MVEKLINYRLNIGLLVWLSDPQHQREKEEETGKGMKNESGAI